MWDLSSPPMDQTHVPCIGRRILNHWTTREVPAHIFSLNNYHASILASLKLLCKHQFHWQLHITLSVVLLIFPSLFLPLQITLGFSSISLVPSSLAPHGFSISPFQWVTYSLSLQIGWDSLFLENHRILCMCFISSWGPQSCWKEGITPRKVTLPGNPIFINPRATPSSE